MKPLLALLLLLLLPIATSAEVFSPPVDVPIAITTVSCPFTLDGGCAAAPSGTIQYPSLLSGGYTQTPHNAATTWNVAGVDYYAGIPVGTALTDWESISQANVTVNIPGRLITCSGSGATVTLSGIDFSLHNGAAINIPSGGCSSITITNSKIGCNVSTTGPSFTWIRNNNNASIVFTQNDVDWSNCDITGTAQSPPIVAGTIKYNHFINTGGEWLGGDCFTYTLTVQYNLFDNVTGFEGGTHPNYLQWTCGTGQTIVWQYNTSLQTSLGGAEGPQFYNNVTIGNMNTTFDHNIMIAKINGGSSVMSNMVHGNCQSGCPAGNTSTIAGVSTVSTNYFDQSGGNAFYPGSFVTKTGTWIGSGNTDMNSGATITFPPP